MFSRLLHAFALAVITNFCGITNLTASEPIVIGKGVDPKWSPIKERLAYLLGDSLFVVASELDSTPRFVHFGPILHYEWLNDSCLLVQERFNVKVKIGRLITNKVSTVCLDGTKSEVTADSGIVGKDDIKRLSVRKLASGEVGYFVDIGGQEKFLKLAQTANGYSAESNTGIWVAPDPIPDGVLYLYYGSSGTRRRLTTTENYYALPVLSPSGDRLFCVCARGEVVVFDTLGIELANLGRVDFPTWSSDGEWIAFCETSYTEFDISSSDICIARFDGSRRRRLTNTVDIVEVEPVFSPDRSKLIFRVVGSGALEIIGTE